MIASTSSDIRLSEKAEEDVFLEAQELIERLSDVICTCPACMAKLRASKSDLRK